MINGTGRDSIRRCYDRQAIRMKALKFLFKKRWPSEFDEYIKAINIQFGNEKSVFYDVNSMDEMIARNQFERSSCRYMSTGYGGELLEWQQFIRYLRGKKVLAKNWFVPTYWIFSFLKMIGRNTNATAILYVAKNKKNSH